MKVAGECPSSDVVDEGLEIRFVSAQRPQARARARQGNSHRAPDSFRSAGYECGSARQD
jgi:hypothetical protein